MVLARTRCLVLLALTSCFAVGCAGSGPRVDSAVQVAEFDPFERDRLEAALRFLASDSLMGRRTGTPGNDTAAAFLAERFEAAGLTPVPGHESFMQTIAFAQAGAAASLSLTVGDQTWNDGDLVLLHGEAASLSAEAVFVGHGLDANDYDGAQGQIAVARVGTPGGGVGDAFGAAADKRALAAEAGAVALVEVYALPLPWPRIAAFVNRDRITIGGPSLVPHAWVHDPEGAWLAAVTEDATWPSSLATSGVRTTPIPSSNVAGYIVGADPDLRDEVLVLVAHYDHVGAGMTNGAGATPADSIFNGARDNGMGTVALLAAAEALAQERPRRSILALAVTGEEEGLLGSRYYVEHPLFPLEQTVFALNTDGAGYSVTDRVAIVGLGRTSADAAITEGVASAGLEVGDDPAPEQGLFDRSDNVNFARAGVPTLTFSPGLTSFQDDVIARYYHNAADEVDEAFDFAYLQRFARAYAATARLIADGDVRPTWAPGDEYADEAAALYGED
ncbi:MAG: M28 family peptidase [Bacteroidota bacterium]